MKKIDKLLIKSFLPPFVVTFLIAIFVLLMQFLWLYIDDIAGKGLGLFTIFELLGYKSAGLIPMALPLAILISSVLVLGNMGEQYELASLKSGGVSLIRIMRPMIIIGAFLAYGSYLSSNYLIPVANLKFGSRMFDIQQQKPALNINEGEFNDDFHGFSIRVGEKDKDGRHIRDILIYNHLEASKGLMNLITAKHGEMYMTPDQKYFVFDLFDGNQYVEAKLKKSGKGVKKKSFPFTRTKFRRWTKMFDLTEFMLTESDANIFKQNRNMLTIKQLREAVDSIDLSIKKREISLNNQIANYLSFVKKDKSLFPKKKTMARKDKSPMSRVDSAKLAKKKLERIERNKKIKSKRKSYNPAKKKTKKKANPKLAAPKNKRAKNKKPPAKNKKPPGKKKDKNLAYQQDTSHLSTDTSFIQTFVLETDKGNILSKVKSSLRSIHTTARNTAKSLGRIRENKVKHIFDLHTKYSMAVICLVFIFIGAPMGALVRKGGFGFPVLFAIFAFVSYIMMTIFFKKLSETFALSPELAAWMPIYVIAPFGALLTYMAMKDLKLPKVIIPVWLEGLISQLRRILKLEDS